MVYPCLPHVSIAINRGPKTPSFLEELTLWHHHTQLDTIDFTTLWMVYICDIMISYIYIHIYTYIATSSFYPHMDGQGRPCGWQFPLALAPSWAASPFRPGRPSPKRSQGIHNLSIQCSAGPASHFGWTRNMSVCRPVERDQHRSTTVITYKNHPLFLFFHRSGCRSSLHLALLWGKHWFSGGERIWQDY